MATNSQMIKEIRSYLSKFDKSIDAKSSITRFTAKEASKIVEVLVKEPIQSDSTSLLRQNIKNWSMQKSSDLIPNGANLENILSQIRKKSAKLESKAKSSDVASVPSVDTNVSIQQIDWNMVICKAIENHDVSTIMIENGSIVIDFK